MATKYQLTSEGDDVTRLTAALGDPNAFRGAADDLLRSIGIGPPELARLTVAPKETTQSPPAETTSPATAAAVASTLAPTVDNLPA